MKKDSNLRQKQCKRSEFVNDDEFLITHISNFRPVKRTLDVIDIFDKIQKQMPAKVAFGGRRARHDFSPTSNQ